MIKAQLGLVIALLIRKILDSMNAGTSNSDLPPNSTSPHLIKVVFIILEKTMKNKISIAAIVLCSGVGFSNSAFAAFIDHSTYTTDTTSGLDWLDVNQTINLSKSYVLSQLNTGGLYEGWRYATGIELLSLANNYTGLNNNDLNTNYSLGYNTLMPLIQLLGITYSNNITWNYGNPGSDERYSVGQSIENTVTGFIADEEILFDRFNNPISYTYTAFLSNKYDDYIDNNGAYHNEMDFYRGNSNQYGAVFNDPRIGSFLVREAGTNSVPEPSIFSLLLIGLFGLALRQRKQLGRDSTN